MFRALGIWYALDGVPRERLSSRRCVKQAMDTLFVAKQQLLHVLKKIELNRRFIQFCLKSIYAHGIRHRSKPSRLLRLSNFS